MKGLIQRQADRAVFLAANPLVTSLASTRTSSLGAEFPLELVLLCWTGSRSNP